MKMTRKLIGAGIASALAFASAGANAAGAWEGFYIGAGVGAAEGDAGFVFTNGNPANPRTQDLGTGVLLNLHAGYQMQFGNFVVGAEASANVSNDLNGNADCPTPTFSCNIDVSDFYILGVRLGYAFSNTLMVSVNGGYANARIDTATPLKATNVNFDTTSERHDGWALGVGVDYALNKNFTVGLNYTRVELDTSLHTSPVSSINDRNIIDPELDVVTARLSYAFR